MNNAVKIKNDPIALNIYKNLSNTEWSGFQNIIDIVRETFPKIDIYPAKLSDGVKIVFGRKEINEDPKGKGKPLLVIRKLSHDKRVSISMRVDSKQFRANVAEQFSIKSWDDFRRSYCFNLSDFPEKSNEFRNFIGKLNRLGSILDRRVAGSGNSPSNYNLLIDGGFDDSSSDNNDEALIEGAGSSVLLTRYERNRKARRICLAHHGTSCAICHFDFGDRYGSEYKNLIHVHHKVPLAEIGGVYNVDPVKHLIPVCPNCHAILHSTKTVKSLKDVKKLIEQRGTSGS